MPSPIAMKSERLIVANIEALLVQQHKQQKALALWCRKTEPWLSAVLKHRRRLMLYDVDRIADFFGLTAYQLFQPGLLSIYDRRKRQRRTTLDRRQRKTDALQETERSRMRHSGLTASDERLITTHTESGGSDAVVAASSSSTGVPTLLDLGRKVDQFITDAQTFRAAVAAQLDAALQADRARRDQSRRPDGPRKSGR